MRGHVRGSTGVKVPDVVHRWSERHGAECRGQRVLVPNRSANHRLVLGRRQLLRLEGLLDGGQVSLLGKVHPLGQQSLLQSLLLRAGASLGKRGQWRGPGAGPHLNGPRPRIVEVGPGRRGGLPSLFGIWEHDRLSSRRVCRACRCCCCCRRTAAGSPVLAWAEVWRGWRRVERWPAGRNDV